MIDALAALGEVIVEFSGGVDSGVLSELATEALATEALGPAAVMATAVSPSLTAADREDAAHVTAQRGWHHREVPTDEFDNDAYVANRRDRCFHCRNAFQFQPAGWSAVGAYESPTEPIDGLAPSPARRSP